MGLEKRANGCAPPFGKEQVAAWVGQPLLLAWFVVVGFGFLPAYGQLSFTIAVGVLWSAGVAVGLGCWLFCQLTDASRATEVRGCLPTKLHDAHYCAVCKKSVPGIDVSFGVWALVGVGGSRARH